MKRVLVYLLILLSTPTLADTVDCSGAEKNYQEHINGLKRQCTQTKDCRADSLDWDPCAKQVIHSDASSAPLLAAALEDISKICPRPARPCPAPIAKPICFDGLCEDLHNLGSNQDKTITIQFKEKSVPLVNAKVNLNVDTGIRCVTTPCDSSRLVETFVTDNDGKIYLSVGKIIQLMNGGDSSAIHRPAGPDGYSWHINNIGYHGIDLPNLLVDTQKIRTIDF
jgi:hypothetical protein